MGSNISFRNRSRQKAAKTCPATAFPKFLELPLELQDAVWRRCLPRSDTVSYGLKPEPATCYIGGKIYHSDWKISVNDEVSCSKHDGSLMKDEDLWIIRSARAIFSVCRESSRVYLRHLPLTVYAHLTYSNAKWDHRDQAINHDEKAWYKIFLTLRFGDEQIIHFEDAWKKSGLIRLKVLPLLSGNDWVTNIKNVTIPTGGSRIPTMDFDWEAILSVFKNIKRIQPIGFMEIDVEEYGEHEALGLEFRRLQKRLQLDFG